MMLQFAVDSVNSLFAGTKQEMMEQIRADIRDFKTAKKLDKVTFKLRVNDHPHTVDYLVYS